MFGFKKIIFMLVITILLLGFVATPLTVLAGPENLKVAVVVEDADYWMTQVKPSFENEYIGVNIELEVMPWEPLYARIIEDFETHEGYYDVVVMKSSRLPELIAYAEDLTKYRKDFESAGIDFVEYNGRILGASSPGPDANQDWMLTISKNCKNKDLALELLKITDYLNEAKILSQDNFNTSGSGWSISTNDERKKTYKSGKYSITVKKPNWQFISWAPGESFPADFKVKVEARQVAGPTGKYGIIWGKDGDNYYVFTISSDGRYRLRKQVNDVWQKKPVSWTNSPAIKRGTDSNQLKVNVIGNSITLIVNDTVLTTVKGSSFGPGKIGLVGGSFDDTDVEVQFDNIKIVGVEMISKVTSQEGDQITFISNRYGKYEIFVMNADGSDQKRLAKNLDDWDYAWSPDSKHIAFNSDRNRNYEIYVMNADGFGQRNLTKNPASDCDYAWSPDSKHIAFISDRDGNEEVYIMNAGGSDQRRLTNNAAYESYPSWSPDGRRIAFFSDRNRNLEIFVMNTDGSDQKRLTKSLDIFEYTWSPDSKHIAFNCIHDGNWEIFVMKADGSGQTNLTNNPALDWDYNWSPDSKHIAFISDRDGNEEVYIMNADGSGQTNLTNNPAWEWRPTWSNDGKHIVFNSNRDGNWEVYVMNVDGSGQTNLTNNSAWDDCPNWLNKRSSSFVFAVSPFTCMNRLTPVARFIGRTNNKVQISRTASRSKINKAPPSRIKEAKRA